MIDNYDSFTYNLVQYFGELGAQVKVYRNDAISLDEIALLKPFFMFQILYVIFSATAGAAGGLTSRQYAVYLLSGLII